MKQAFQRVGPNIALDRVKPQEWNGHICVDGVATSGPQPRATLTASDDELRLTSTLGDFKLSRSAVLCVRRAGIYPWLWGGFRIYHSVPGYPQRLQFCPIDTRSRQVLAQLSALGFKTG